VNNDLTRRELLETTAFAGISTILLGTSSSPTRGQAADDTPPANIEVALKINGTTHHLAVDPRSSLLDTLRDRLDLTGAKKGCDRGECGACTIHADGRRALSCMILAVMAEGMEITTIEGLATAQGLHPVQAAFIEHDAFQCGYCTSGQIMSAVACIREGHTTSEEAIREFMSGNICRCAAYPQIVAAVKAAAAVKGI
jgi:xanthine dehydrogenase YagT iron-sulfur-binding subunit